jgi:UPF0271 protein
MTMKLNADVGEGAGHDRDLFQWIDMANIACGYHAGGPDEMVEAVDLALSYGVAVGAHPGYPDRENFGRNSMDFSPEQIASLIVEQVGSLNEICQRAGAKIHYVKPHGALYHDMMTRIEVYEAILHATSCLIDDLALMIMARKDDEGDRRLAAGHGVPLLFEAFADRGYRANGSLLDRGERGAVYTDTRQMVEQVVELGAYGSITSHCGSKIMINADTVCVHGDNKASVNAAKEIHLALRSC